MIAAATATVPNNSLDATMTSLSRSKRGATALVLACVGVLCFLSSESNSRRSLLTTTNDLVPPDPTYQRNLSQDNGDRNVLILGDSISRLVVHSACRNDHDILTTWDPEGIFDDYAGITTALCEYRTPQGGLKKIGHIHLYGSHATIEELRPQHQSCTETHPYCLTPERMCKAIDLYTENEGVPDHIILAIMLWDTQPFPGFGHIQNNDPHIAHWKETITKRMEEVLKCMPEGSTLSLQTTPAGPGTQDDTYKVMWRLNHELRDLAKERGMCLIDFDWALHGGRYGQPYDYSNEDGLLTEENAEKMQHLFRDGIHPNKVQVFRHGQHLLHKKGTTKGCLSVVKPYDRSDSEEMTPEWFRDNMMLQ